MRFRFVACALALVACSTDVFAPSDSGSDSGLDASAADAIADTAAKPDVIVAFDASGKGVIACGSMGCDPKNSVCCGSNVWTSEACVPSSGCEGVGQDAIACDDRTDCNGNQICCASFVGVSTQIAAATCKDSCTAQDVQLCRSSGECSSANCAALSATPSGYEKCQ